MEISGIIVHSSVRFYDSQSEICIGKPPVLSLIFSLLRRITSSQYEKSKGNRPLVIRTSCDVVYILVKSNTLPVTQILGVYSYGSDVYNTGLQTRNN